MKIKSSLSSSSFQNLLHSMSFIYTDTVKNACPEFLLLSGDTHSDLKCISLSTCRYQVKESKGSKEDYAGLSDLHITLSFN